MLITARVKIVNVDINVDSDNKDTKFSENVGNNGKGRDEVVIVKPPSNNDNENTIVHSDSGSFTCPDENDENNPNGLYANSEDCNTFWQCSNDHAYLMNCPDDLQWSTEQLRCEWPENSDCGAKGNGSNERK
ncbi:44753_t:CDS:2 [Gigaspora margarita]|uniref:44753_t:CDS:1 n=1 Tax=Gigaspora margarita TaxID=4874 RepID=A0ABM8W067_GIGMA|nr:44753_t:CDS:2 [Gigaspora margarita]